MWLKWESCLIRLPLFIIGCEWFSQYLSSAAVLSSWCASLNPAVIWGQQDRCVDKNGSFWSDESASGPLSRCAVAVRRVYFRSITRCHRVKPTPTSARIRWKAWSSSWMPPLSFWKPFFFKSWNAFRVYCGVTICNVYWVTELRLYCEQIRGF